MQEFKIPENLDWWMWINRWDKMQEKYIAKRSERFQMMVQLIRDTQDNINRILDLGCGTGSLMLEMLNAFADAEVFGIDFDPTLIPLAQRRLAEFKNRANIVLDDLRKTAWLANISKPIDAVVSATALHWMQPDELIELYDKLAGILKPGGIFLNADHVGSDSNQIQNLWQKFKARSSYQYEGETWEHFWSDYMSALGLETTQVCQRVLGGWEGGIEDGMPLTWHFDKLKGAGFVCVDCFWRFPEVMRFMAGLSRVVKIRSSRVRMVGGAVHTIISNSAT